MVECMGRAGALSHKAAVRVKAKAGPTHISKSISLAIKLYILNLILNTETFSAI
jgi:hypothetical protein